MTDVLYIDIVKNRIVKRIELVSVISPEERLQSKCRFVCYHSEKLYIVDEGLCRVLVYYNDDNGVTSFGEPGSCIGQFQSPSAIVVDGEGMCLVVDTGNNRLHVMESDSDLEYRCVGVVKTDWPLYRPTRACLDMSRRELWVTTERGVVSYRM